MNKDEKENKLAKELGGVEENEITLSDNENVSVATTLRKDETKSLIEKIRDKIKNDRRQRRINKGNSIVKKANLSLADKNFDEAILYFQDANTIFLAQKYNKGCEQCVDSISKCYYEKAQKLTLDAKKLENENQFIPAINLYYEASKNYSLAKFKNHADICQKHIYDCYEKFGNTFFNKALDKYENKDYSNALENFLRAKNNYNASKSYSKYKHCDNLISQCYTLNAEKEFELAKNCQEYNSAIKHYDRTLTYYRKAGDHEKIKQCQRDLTLYIYSYGEKLYNNSDFKNALPYLEKANGYFRVIKDDEIKSKCTILIADCLYEQAKEEKNKKRYDQALKTCELALSYYELSNYDYGMNICKKTLEDLNNLNKEYHDDNHLTNNNEYSKEYENHSK